MRHWPERNIVLSFHWGEFRRALLLQIYHDGHFYEFEFTPREMRLPNGRYYDPMRWAQKALSERLDPDVAILAP